MTDSERSPLNPGKASNNGSGIRTSRRVFIGGLTVAGVLGGSAQVAAADEVEDDELLGYGVGDYGESGFGGVSPMAPAVTIDLDGPAVATEDEATVFEVAVQNEGDDVPEDVQLNLAIGRAEEIAMDDVDVEHRASNDDEWTTLDVSEADGTLIGKHPNDGFTLPSGELYDWDFRITFRKTDEFTINVSVMGIEEGEVYATSNLAVAVEYAEEEPDEIELSIVIKPGTDRDEKPAPINPNSGGRTPVGILSVDAFDSIDKLDVDSLRFGPPRVVDEGEGGKALHHTEEDVSGDGELDMKILFDSTETGFDDGDEYGKVVGETQDGTPAVGNAEIRIVGGGNGGDRGNRGGQGRGN